MFGTLTSTVVIVAVFILESTSYCRCESHLNCGYSVRSTCPDNITTKWNSDSIHSNLKDWMSSIRKGESNIENQALCSTKTIIGFEEKNELGKHLGYGVQYIARRDYISNKHVGPTWRKPSLISLRQFNDGFLYGIEDKNGELTG